ncbi:MAG: beta-N-acetylhexosaminidase [Bdellovibrionales bacterium]|nr:beta-N-acetylhexosaminidase [Bdellovibrionales bacterium]
MQTNVSIWIGIKSFSLSLEEKRAIEEGFISGVLLFKRNIESLSQLWELCQEIHSLRPAPIIAIDREGGEVDRLKHLPEYPLWPSPAELARVCSLKEIEKTALYMSQEIRDLGICVNFAPCVDIPSVCNPLFKGRLWGKNSKSISEKAIAWLKGVKKAGLASCAKHFPGHGGVKEDSHFELPVDQRKFEILKNRDILPFQEMITEKVDMIMTAHVLYPEVDALHPATLSSFFLQKGLREKMSFSGLIVSDDLDMKALYKANTSLPQVMVQALEAGVDILLKCSPCANGWEWVEEFKEALSQKKIDREQIQKNKAREIRISQFRQQYSHIKPCSSFKGLKKRSQSFGNWCDELHKRIESI